MSLVRFKNNNRVNHFSDVWEDFFKRELTDSRNACVSGNTVPAANISESQKGFSIELAAPGFNKEDFNLSIDKNDLILEVNKEIEVEKEGSYTRKEFNYKNFKRSFKLPNTVNHNKISASYVNGILGVEIPKKEDAILPEKKSIEIK